MDLKGLINGAGKDFLDQYLKSIKLKLKIGAVAVSAGIILLVVLFAGASNGGKAEASSGYTSFTNSGLIGAEFLRSWENVSVSQYIHGNTPYNDRLRGLVTEDKNYYICYTDFPNNDRGDRNFAYGVCHTPDFGKTYWHVQQYQEEGIVINSGNYDTVGSSQISISVVDKVFEKLYEGYKESVRNSFFGINIEETKLDALTAVKYQYGNIGNAVELYKNNGNFVTEFTVNNGKGGYYTPFNSEGTYKGSASRVEANKELFLNGVYKTGDGRILTPSDFSGQGIVEIAKKIHDYIKDNNYAYSCSHNVNSGYINSCECDGDSAFGKNNFDEYPNIRCIDCSAYVSWVLNEYLGDSQFNSRWNSAMFGNSSNWPKGWTKVKIEDIQPGDILWTSGHVGIYIGDGKTVEAGCTNAIRKDYSYGSIQSVIAKYTYAIRIP